MKYPLSGLLLLLLSACGGSGSDDNSGSTPPVVSGNNTLAYEHYVQENMLEISSLTASNDFSDLQPLGQLLAGKRIVQLGESTHGSKQMNQMKTRLIKYLHQQQGFNVIAFESSMFACNQQLETTATNPIILLHRCIFGVWHTQEVMDLFAYIISTQQTERPLRLAGFDVQFSSSYDTAANLKNYLHQLSNTFLQPGNSDIDAAVDKIFQLRSLAESCVLGSQSNCAPVLADYQAPQAVFASLADALAGAEPEMIRGSVIARSLVYQLELYAELASGYTGQVGKRDEFMAVNINALAQQVYPQDKIIVWAHNAHIMTDYRNSYYRAQQDKSMGMYLKSQWQDDLYTLGLYMLAGSSMDTNTGLIAVTPHQADSLEALVNTAGKEIIFLPFARHNMPGSEDDWLHRLTATKFWGAWQEYIYPAKSYDGVLVIRHSGIPDYL